MTDSGWDYTADALGEGLRTAGIERGDLVFVHVCDELGRMKGGTDDPQRCALLLGALRDAVGEQGTILVPTYTFSFCRQEPFDVRHTPTDGGPWSTDAAFLEFFRQQPDAVRSADPIHSVAGIGPQARALLADVPRTCFGVGSVFDRLHAAGGKICMLGVGLHEASFQHHVEEMVGVPFRYRKLFTGTVTDGARSRKTGWVYNVRVWAENSEPHPTRVEGAARAAAVCRAARVGRGEVLVAECGALFTFLAAELARDPWFSARGPAADPLALERERLGASPPVALPEHASMAQIVEALWPLKRDLVSDEYDVALAALASQIPLTIHEYPTGTECWTWLVPERWTCHEAYLETLDGRRVFSYADHPLHVVSYSLPFEGEMTREELFRHLHVHHRMPDAVPFIFKYYERDWGLCCSKLTRDTLRGERYRVVIRTSFSYSTLKVGECVVPGRSDETIVLCAHLCHPGQVNDDLTGVAVGIDVMRALAQRRDLRYTYRLLIVPETIGSVAYLSRHQDLIPQMKGGLFLEMLGMEYPHSLQLSFDGASEVDQCFVQALEQADPYSWTGAFPTIIGNDERQFNAPGVRVPMLSLSRVLPRTNPAWPYPYYHSDHDTPERISTKRLEESRDVVLQMIDTLEQNIKPLNRFQGEIFCSRYGIQIDWWTNPEATRALFDVMYLVDGTLSIAEIANRVGVSFEAARQVVAELARHGLVTAAE